VEFGIKYVLEGPVAVDVVSRKRFEEEENDNFQGR